MALWLDADPSGLTWTGLDCDDDLALLCAVALERRGLSGVQITGGGVGDVGGVLGVGRAREGGGHGDDFESCRMLPAEFGGNMEIFFDATEPFLFPLRRSRCQCCSCSSASGEWQKELNSTNIMNQMRLYNRYK